MSGLITFGRELSKLPIIILFLCEVSRSFFIFGVLPNRHDVLSFAIIGYAIAAHYTVDTLSKLWIGWLLDHFPRRFVVAAHLFVSFVSLLELGGATRSVWVIAWCAAFGLGTSSIWMYVLSQATTLPTQTARNFMSKVFTAWFVAIGIGYLMGNASVFTNIPYLNYILYVGWGLAVVLTFTFPQNDSKAGQKSFNFFEGFQREVFQKAWYAIPGMFLQTFAGSVLMPILQYFFLHQLGLSVRQLAILGATGGFFLLLGLTIIGRVSALPFRFTLSTGFFVLAVSFFGMTTVDSFVLLLGVGVLIGGGYAVVLTSWNALLLSIIPKQNQGLGWGVISMIEGAGMACGNSISGFLGSSYGANASILCSSILLCLLGVWYFPYRKVVPILSSLFGVESSDARSRK